MDILYRKFHTVGIRIVRRRYEKYIEKYRKKGKIMTPINTSSEFFSLLESLSDGFDWNHYKKDK